MNGEVNYNGLYLTGAINVRDGANLEHLNVTENGIYTPGSGVDGYDRVTVDVPTDTSILSSINITENGMYLPPSGVDGYDEINVNVPSSNLSNTTFTQNGTYTPSGVVDGWDRVTVDVDLDLDSIEITENGTYTPPSGVNGYDEISVSVEPKLDSITITENGTYTPPTGTDGYNEISVNVAGGTPVLTRLDAYANGRYTPPTGTDGYNEVRVRVYDAITDTNCILFINEPNGLVVSFYGVTVHQVENLSSHFNNAKFYNVFKDRQVWCKVYDSVDATTPLGYIGFYQNTIRAWDLSLSQNITIEGGYGSIVLSDVTQQQDNNGCIIY